MTTWAEDTNLDGALLEAYCLGTVSPDEASQIEAWFSMHPEQRAWYEQFRAEIQKEHFAPAISAEERHAAWSEFLQVALQGGPEAKGDLAVFGSSDFDATLSADHHHPENLPRRPFLGAQPLQRVRWSVAGIALLIAMTTVATWRTKVQRAARRIPSMMTYTTGNGERATIALPDGETVSLNVASRLDVPMDYQTGDRTIRLTGEALFTVSHHAGTPLTVVAGHTATRVLGTSFVVRHYPTDTSAMVAVRDGKVAVGATVVTANQMVNVGENGVPHIRSVDGAPFSFTTGTLTIDGLSLPEAIVELNRWYDADIRLADPVLGKRRVQGTFGAGSLGELAEELELTYDVRVVRHGRVLTLFPRR